MELTVLQRTIALAAVALVAGLGALVLAGREAEESVPARIPNGSQSR